ncbi:MAG: hypothetical protein QHJ73_01540 [Armatimonadota bacterium]|nr:hypothetical protein [Armatimonadota bacterium]
MGGWRGGLRQPRAHALLTLLALGALTAGTATAHSAPADGAAAATEVPRLLFTRFMAGTYLKTPDEERLVSYSHGDTICPRLLPGTDQILLNSMRGGTAGVWLQDLAGNPPTRVCDGDQASPSPDGRRILFRRAGAIVERNLASGTERTLSPPGWSTCAFPSFGPDGSVLFVVSEAGRERVYLRRGDQPVLLAEGEIPSAPRLSPDGQTLAYQNGAHLWLLHTATRKPTRLTFAGGVQSWPVWSRDGQRVAFLQSAGPVGGPWQICAVSRDNPLRVSFVLPDAGPGPDWNGLGFTGRMPLALQGDEVRCFTRPAGKPGPIPTSDPEKAKSGWAAMADAAPSSAREVLVQCAWGGCMVSPASGVVRLLERQEEALVPRVEVTFTSAEGNPVRRFAGARVEPPGGDTVTLLALGSGASCVISRTRPFVKIAPNRPVRLSIRQRLTCVVAPDRLAGDVVLLPHDGPAENLVLPRSPFYLGLPSDGRGMLMVAAGAGQVTARTDQRRATFSEVTVGPAAEPVIVAALPGEDLWRTPTVKATEGNPVAFAWACPMAAQWRLATRGDESASLMLPMDSPARENVATVDALSSPPRLAWVYAYGRTRNTPPDRWTPLDVLQDALGLKATAALLDLEGVRGYRHADQPVPYKDPRAALKMLGWIRVRTRPGAQKRIDDVCGDIVASLKGLDARLAEYAAFARALEKESEQNGVPQSIVRRVERLRSTVEAQSVTPVSQAAEPLEAFRAGRGPLDAAASAVLKALTERQTHLAAYRALARGACLDAAFVLARDPSWRARCEAVRERCHRVLRYRYYLEGDWRGEEPLGGPEVQYEAVADL